MSSLGKACQTCKSRRIKCDGLTPICQRCVKSRRICIDVGTARHAAFSIHVENSYASGEIQRPRGPRSSLTAMQPSLDLHSKALANYLQHHLKVPADTSSEPGSWSECVSAWILSGSACAMINLALSAMALAVYARIQKHTLVSIEASVQYCSLLRVANERLSHIATSRNIDERDIDSCLMTIFLMGRYEGATYRRSPSSMRESFTGMKSFSHHDGAMAILKVWNDNLSHKTVSSVVKLARRGLIRSALLRNMALPNWILDGGRFGEHGTELDYDRIFAEIVNFRRSCLSSHLGDTRQNKTLEKLVSEAHKLDKLLETWVYRISIEGPYEQHTLTELSSCPKKHFYSQTVYTFSKPGHAVVWSQYFASRMFIHSTILKIIEADRSNKSNYLTQGKDQVHSATRVRIMANKLASTIPFCLERIIEDNTRARNNHILINPLTDAIEPYLATLVVWPLTIASSVTGTGITQRLWFRSELANLGAVTGDGILECAESDQWASL